MGKPIQSIYIIIHSCYLWDNLKAGHCRIEVSPADGSNVTLRRSAAVKPHRRSNRPQQSCTTTGTLKLILDATINGYLFSSEGRFGKVCKNNTFSQIAY